MEQGRRPVWHNDVNQKVSCDPRLVTVCSLRNRRLQKVDIIGIGNRRFQIRMLDIPHQMVFEIPEDSGSKEIKVESYRAYPDETLEVVVGTIAQAVIQEAEEKRLLQITIKERINHS